MVLAVALLLAAASPAAASWAPAEVVSKSREDPSRPVAGPGGQVVYQDDRRVVLVSADDRRRALGRTRRPYEQAAVDRRGNVVVLYRVRVRRPDGRGTTTAVETQTLSRSRGVSRPRRLGRFALQPTLAVNAGGRAVAAWVRDLPANRFAVVAARGTARRGLRRAGRISRADGQAKRPRAAVGPRGLAMVAFAKDGRLRVVARPRGGPFGAAEDVGPASGRGRPNVALSVGRRGDAVVAWGIEVSSEPGDPGSPVLAAIRRDGRWQPVQELPGPMHASTDGPSAVMAPDGRALVGWATAVGYEDPAAPRVALAPGGAPVFGPPQDLAAPADVRAVAVGTGPNGTLHAAWVRDLSVQVATRGALGPWSAGRAVHEAPAHGLTMGSGHLALDSPAGVQVARYAAG